MPESELTTHAVTALFAVVVVVGLVLLATVVRLRKRLARSRAARNREKLDLIKFSSAVTNSGSMILITDARGEVEFVNDRFCELTGFRSEDITGQSIAMLSAVVDLTGRETGVLTNFLDCLKPHWKGELLCRTKESTPLWAAVTTASIVDDDGLTSSYVVSAVDITELKKAHHHMAQLALFDPLTGLANRRLFQDRLEQALTATRRRKTQIGLMLLDLDQFKRINDTLGHDAGDILLRTVADRLKACVRGQDTVARLGGDEFTVLLTDIRDSGDLSLIAQNILQSLSAPIALQKQPVIVSASIGITTAPDDGLNPQKLMKNADLALYRAKDKGRDQYHFYTEELNQRAIRLMTVEQELRHGLQRDEFQLQFQPQFDLRSGEMVAMEALVRWEHPSRGIIQPEEFLSVAEETGLSIPLGNWVLRHACQQMQQLHRLTDCNLRIAVNVSARQLRDPALKRVIQHALDASGLDPAALEIEVTETMLMGDIKAVETQLASIRSLGIRIVIDDFGTGYSSLRHLRHLPVDALKVDQEFVQDIPGDRNKMDIAAAVIGIAHKMGLRVIAEGIETDLQRQYLISHNCDYGQGFHLSRPLSFEDLRDFYQDYNRPGSLNA